jgi:hypothetical protein
MKKISAFKCDMTAKVFLTERDALRSEFEQKLKAAAGQVGADDAVKLMEVFPILAGHLSSQVYKSFWPKLKEAFDFYEKHQFTINGHLPGEKSDVIS